MRQSGILFKLLTSALARIAFRKAFLKNKTSAPRIGTRSSMSLKAIPLSMTPIGRSIISSPPLSFKTGTIVSSRQEHRGTRRLEDLIVFVDGLDLKYEVVAGTVNNIVNQQ